MQVYAIAIRPHPHQKAYRAAGENRGLAFMEDLAEKTGGPHFAITGGERIGRVVEAATQSLRNHYVIGYQPAETDRTERLRSTPARQAFADVSADDLQKMIDEAVEDVRAKHYRERAKRA